MKVLIYSDVHGNLPAFEIMLEKEGRCDRYICLGDLVNYGPWSNECVELALSLPNSSFIMGNHEEAFLLGKYPGTNAMVQAFFEKTWPTFTKHEEIKKFDEYCELDRFICRHTVYNSYVYPDTQITLDQHYLIGHSHYQFRYANNGFDLINAGSVGQNRKYINEINYLVYDSEKQLVTEKSIVYDVDVVIEQMKKQNYPAVCVDYYLKKDRI